MSEILKEISENLQHGKAKVVKALVQQAIDEGLPAQQILEDRCNFLCRCLEDIYAI